MLAAKIHLEKWMNEILPNEERSTHIANQGFISDEDCSRRVADWAYRNAATAGSLAWVKGGLTEMVGNK
jgi:hypothetical protein